MADTSERILILSAVLLVGILVRSNQLYQIELINEKEVESIGELDDTILTWKDMQIQIATSRDNYTLGERFTVTIYLVNNRTEEIKMKPVAPLTVSGGEDRTDGIVKYTSGFYPLETIITLPANSKKQLVNASFAPQQTGEFIITCLGTNKTVLILDSEFEDDTVHAKMNKQSYHNTEKASLIITNHSPDTIILGEHFKLHKREGDSWIEVSPSLFHPEVWDMIAYIVDIGQSFSQQISIEMLEAGQYRIRKEVHSDTPQEYLLTLIVEFEII